MTEETTPEAGVDFGLIMALALATQEYDLCDQDNDTLRTKVERLRKVFGQIDAKDLSLLDNNGGLEELAAVAFGTKPMTDNPAIEDNKVLMDKLGETGLKAVGKYIYTEEAVKRVTTSEVVDTFFSEETGEQVLERFSKGQYRSGDNFRRGVLYGYPVRACSEFETIYDDLQVLIAAVNDSEKFESMPVAVQKELTRRLVDEDNESVAPISLEQLEQLEEQFFDHMGYSGEISWQSVKYVLTRKQFKAPGFVFSAAGDLAVDDAEEFVDKAKSVFDNSGAQALIDEVKKGLLSP